MSPQFAQSLMPDLDKTKNGSTHALGFCPHCCNVAPQRLVFTHFYSKREYEMDGSLADEPPGQGLGCVYHVAICETCDDLLLYYHAGYENAVSVFTETSLMWPTGGQLHTSVPDRVRRIYEEAYRIRSLAPNAFAGQIRRALEALADDRGAVKGTLQIRLQNLALKGDVPPVLAEMTDVLRLLGNVGVHASDQEVMPYHAFVIDDFFRAVIEYVYVAPSKIKDFQEMLKSRRAG